MFWLLKLKQWRNQQKQDQLSEMKQMYSEQNDVLMDFIADHENMMFLTDRPNCLQLLFVHTRPPGLCGLHKIISLTWLSTIADSIATESISKCPFFRSTGCAQVDADFFNNVSKWWVHWIMNHYTVAFISIALHS